MNRSWLCTLALYFASPASAQTMLDFALDVDAPADAQCTSPAVLARAIEARVGRLVFLNDPDPSRRIHVEVARDRAQVAWSAAIVMRDDRDRIVGERRVTADAPACEALDEALIVVISTLIGIADETRPAAPAEEESPQPPRSAGSRPAAPATQPSPAPAPNALPAITHRAEGDSDDTRSELALDLAARADLALLPGIAPGVTLALDLDFDAWGISIGATAVPYVAHDLGDGAAARFSSALGELGACLRAARPLGAALDFCAAAQGGVIAISTSGLAARVVDRIEPLVRALIGPRLRVRFAERFGLIAGVDATAPLFAPRYFLLDAGGERQYYHSVELGFLAQIGIYWLLSPRSS